MPCTLVQIGKAHHERKKPMTSSTCNTVSYGAILIALLILSICASPVRGEGPTLRLRNVAGKPYEGMIRPQSELTPAFVQSKSAVETTARDSKDNLKSVSKGVASVIGVLVLGVSMTI